MLHGQRNARKLVQHFGHRAAYALRVLVHIVRSLAGLEVFFELLTLAVIRGRKRRDRFKETLAGYRKWVEVRGEQTAERQTPVLVFMSEIRGKGAVCDQ